MSETGEFFEGFVDDYFAECEEHLTGAARALLALEEAMGDPAAERTAIDELFRLFHAEGYFGDGRAEAHGRARPSPEHYLRAIREREVFVSADGIELLIQGTQRLEQIIGARKLGQPQPAIDDVVARVTALVPAAGAAPPAGAAAARTASANFPHSNDRRWTCTFAPTRELLADGIGVDSIRRRLTEVGTIIQAIPEVRPDGAIAFQFTLATPITIDAIEVLKDLPLAVTAADEATPIEADLTSVPAAGAERTAAAPATHVVRVDLARLDELMRNVGDLVISRARLTDTLGRLEGHVPSAEWRAVHDNAVVIDRQLRTLREGIMRVRLVPIGEIFRRMPFVVRDLARESGKKIPLDLQGQSHEIANT